MGTQPTRMPLRGFTSSARVEPHQFAACEWGHLIPMVLQTFRVSRISEPGWHEIESAEVKKDGSAESLTVAKSAGPVFHLLNFGVEGFADGVGDVEDDRVYYFSKMFFDHASDVLKLKAQNK